MSILTRAGNRVLAEAAYFLGDFKRAGRLITKVAVERIQLAAAEATQTIPGHHAHNPVEPNIALMAIGNGVIRYNEIRLTLETQLQPLAAACATKGILMELQGRDAWCSSEKCEYASVRVKFTPKHNL